MAKETTIDLATLRLDGERYEVAHAAGDEPFDAQAEPIWEQIVSIGSSAAPGTWDDVPTNLSKDIDQFLPRGKPDAK